MKYHILLEYFTYIILYFFLAYKKMGINMSQLSFLYISFINLL